MRSDHVVELDLRAEWLFPESKRESEPEGRPFTAVFSDSDGKGQETLVSTTQRRPTAEKFGELFLAAGKQQLPRLTRITQQWRVVKPGDTLRSLAEE